MVKLSPREVFDDPQSYWDFFTQGSDDDFEGQHFDRKEVGQVGADEKELNRPLREIRKQIIETVSAFANKNVEGGLLVLGIASNGDIRGVDHLSEEQKNSLTDFGAFLHHQAADAKQYRCYDASGNAKTICLIFVPHTDNGICETPGQNPKAWVRSGPQNIPMTQEMRDQIRMRKGPIDFEGTFCCPFNTYDVDRDILEEFRERFLPNSAAEFSDERLLYEAGAIIQRNGEYWFTHTGLLFFGSNPQRVLPRAYSAYFGLQCLPINIRREGCPILNSRLPAH